MRIPVRSAPLTAPCPQCSEPVDWRQIRRVDPEYELFRFVGPVARMPMTKFLMPCECELVGWVLEIHYLDRDDLERWVLRDGSGQYYSYTWGTAPSDAETEQLSIEGGI